MIFLPKNFLANYLAKQFLHQKNYLIYPNIKEMNLDLFRPAEYYESPSEKLNSRVFDELDFLETIVNENGKVLEAKTEDGKLIISKGFESIDENRNYNLEGVGIVIGSLVKEKIIIYS